MKVRGSFWTSHHNHLHHFSPSSSRKKRKRRRRKHRRGLKGLVSTKRSTVSVQTQILILWRIRSNTNSRTASQFSSTITFCESPKLNKRHKKKQRAQRGRQPPFSETKTLTVLVTPSLDSYQHWNLVRTKRKSKNGDPRGAPLSDLKYIYKHLYLYFGFKHSVCFFGGVVPTLKSCAAGEYAKK